MSETTDMNGWIEAQHADIHKDVPPAVAPRADGSPETTGAMIAQLVQIRDRRREIAAEDKELVEQWEALKARVLARMDEEQSNRVASKDGSVSLSETIVPHVKDWDEFEAYLRSTGDLHLLQRRVAIKAFQELHEARLEVPGVVAVVKRDINVRSS
jgi:predicted metal-binding protein